MNLVTIVVWALAIAFIAVALACIARSIRLRKRHPGQYAGLLDADGRPRVLEWKRASCTIGDREIQTACTDSWFEHWWDGVQYCDDGRANCEFYGGVWTQATRK